MSGAVKILISALGSTFSVKLVMSDLLSCANSSREVYLGMFCRSCSSCSNVDMSVCSSIAFGQNLNWESFSFLGFLSERVLTFSLLPTSACTFVWGKTAQSSVALFCVSKSWMSCCIRSNSVGACLCMELTVDLSMQTFLNPGILNSIDSKGLWIDSKAVWIAW